MPFFWGVQFPKTAPKTAKIWKTALKWPKQYETASICSFLPTDCKISRFEKFRLPKVPFLGCPKTPKMAVLGVLRDPKKGTFGNRNFSKRLILQSVGKNEQMDAVSYCFGHFKAVFQILAVFGAVFGNWTPQKNGTSRTRKLNLRPLWKSTFKSWR